MASEPSSANVSGAAAGLPLNRRDILMAGAAYALTPAVARAEFNSQNNAEQRQAIEFVDVVLTVNGAGVRLRLDPRTTLLDALREHLALTGTKKGCDHGQCGACTTIVNNRRVNSCLTLAAMHNGDAVTTVEGLAQQWFSASDAAGVCRTRRVSVRLLYARPDLLERGDAR